MRSLRWITSSLQLAFAVVVLGLTCGGVSTAGAPTSLTPIAAGFSYDGITRPSSEAQATSIPTAAAGPSLQMHDAAVGARTDPEAAAGFAAEDSALFSRGAAQSNMEALAGGRGLPRTAATVNSIAERAGVGLNGVKVRIIDDPNYLRMLDCQGACAVTPSELLGSEIHLGPAAFADEETLAHERTHVMQLQLYGRPGSELLKQFEEAAYGIEPTFLQYFRTGG